MFNWRQELSYLPKIQSHFKQLRSAIVNADMPMWPSVVDVQTGRYLDGDHVPKRVYRLIGAPRGSTLYWDQPLLVTAYVLSDLLNSPLYSQSADVYIQSFLDHCVAPNGMFQWGNHMYYDLHEQKVIEFQDGYHELRPITPAWDMFWTHTPEQTSKYISLMAYRHIYDRSTGGFNRHDDGKKGHAFIEAGGILVESLSWLFSKNGDQELLELALRVARYSYRNRDMSTGLVVNEPDMKRWDSKVSTTEIGVWAQCLLRASTYTDNDEFIEMARNSIEAYLKYGYDIETNMYFGQIAVHTGEPLIPTEKGYWPQIHSDPWNVDQWPNHDYPMAVAEACITLHALTGQQIFFDAVHHWSRIVVESSPEKTGRWAYAESYGRCIHFLTRAGLELDVESLFDDAKALAEQSMEHLYENKMFQGYPKSNVYEAVDGVGYLFLGLIFLETRKEPNLQGFGF